MPCHFNISGTFPLKAGVPDADVLQAAQEARRTWTIDEFDFKIVPGSPRVVHFRFEALSSAAYADEIEQTVRAWAYRFADWTKDVLRYTQTYDGEPRLHCFYGPENRCIETKLSAIEKRIADLQEEWTDCNHTLLPQAGNKCVVLVDRTEGA